MTPAGLVTALGPTNTPGQAEAPKAPVDQNIAPASPEQQAQQRKAVAPGKAAKPPAAPKGGPSQRPTASPAPEDDAVSQDAPEAADQNVDQKAEQQQVSDQKKAAKAEERRKLKYKVNGQEREIDEALVPAKLSLIEKGHEMMEEGRKAMKLWEAEQAQMAEDPLAYLASKGFDVEAAYAQHRAAQEQIEQLSPHEIEVLKLREENQNLRSAEEARNREVAEGRRQQAKEQARKQFWGEFTEQARQNGIEASEDFVQEAARIGLEMVENQMEFTPAELALITRAELEDRSARFKQEHLAPIIHDGAKIAQMLGDEGIRSFMKWANEVRQAESQRRKFGAGAAPEVSETAPVRNPTLRELMR